MNTKKKYAFIQKAFFIKGIALFFGDNSV